MAAMTDVKRLSPDMPACPANVSRTEQLAVPDLEDHILDLGSAIAALRHLPLLDSAPGAYLISRIEAHFEGIRRAYYHLPPLAAD
jgi:hypothetical protein